MVGQEQLAGAIAPPDAFPAPASRLKLLQHPIVCATYYTAFHARFQLAIVWRGEDNKVGRTLAHPLLDNENRITYIESAFIKV